MKRSESIKEISLALAKAQGEMPTVGFDKKSHNNRYASLTAIVEATQPILHLHNLSLIQSFVSQGEQKLIVTTLLHSSGEWIEDDGVPLIIDKHNMQGLGSAITYAKRYGMSAMLRIVTDEDDDGQAAVGHEITTVTDVKKSVTKFEPPKPSAKETPVASNPLICDDCGATKIKGQKGTMYCKPCYIKYMESKKTSK